MRPRHIIVLLLSIGISLFGYSLTLPYYTDETAAKDLIEHSFKFDKYVYYQKEAELRTGKLLYMDLGAGISVASVTMLIFLILTRVKVYSDFRKLITLNKAILFITSNIVWLLLIPGTYWYYSFRAGRGDYAPFADAIAIPIYTEIPVYFMLLIPLNIFMFLHFIKAEFPALLFVRPVIYNKIDLFWEIFFGFCLVANLLLLLAFIADGDHVFIFVSLFFTYVLLNLRAGQISRSVSQQVPYVN